MRDANSEWTKKLPERPCLKST